MPRYALKILLDLEALDDVQARQHAAALVAPMKLPPPCVREIVLHAQADHKSIRMNPDGTFQGQWNRGGPGLPTGPVRAESAGAATKGAG